MNTESSFTTEASADLRRSGRIASGWAVAVVIAVALYLVAGGAIASAQEVPAGEQILGYRIVGEDVAGPHMIELQVSPAAPLAGTIRFAVRVRNAATGADIDDALVRVFGTPSEKGERQYSPGLNSPFDPVYYLLQLDLEHAGVWAIDVEVDSELGSGKTVMSIEIENRGRTGESLAWGSALFALVTLAFASGIVWLWYSSKKALKRREEQQRR